MANGRPVSGVVVTDGLQCAETGADGTYALPGRTGVRFVTVSPPSGWKTACRYHRFDGSERTYDFSLDAWPASKKGAVTFMHIGDSEIDPKRLDVEKAWIARAKAFADERDCAFFVHTGDIDGPRMPLHAELMNERTVGRPVFYVVGNHDIKGQDCGERVFEETFGPCWYSFDAGSVHYVAIPMMWGDGKPTYSAEEIVAWMRNDIAIATRKGMPVILLQHGGYDTRIVDTRRLYDASALSTETCEPFDFTKEANVRAIVHGHNHDNYFNRSPDGKIAVISVAPPAESDETLQVVHVSEAGDTWCEHRYGRYATWPSVTAAPKGGWIAQVNDGVIYYGAPCVSGGRVFVGSMDYVRGERAGVTAFDAATGRKLWFHGTAADVMTRILCDGKRVYVHDTNWHLYALDPKDGSEIWRFDARDEILYTGTKLRGGEELRSNSAMTLDAAHGRLYVGQCFRTLFAVDPATGKVNWRTDAKIGRFVRSATAPLVCDDVVIGWAYWAGTFGYDAKTGKELWRHTLGRSKNTQERHRAGIPWINNMGFPTYRDGKLVLLAHRHYLEVDPKTGTILRQKVFPFETTCFTSPLELDGLLYFGTQREGLVCFDPAKLEVVWKAPVEESMISTLPYQRPPIRSLSSCPVLWKGLVWATAQDGALYAWDPKTGERKERIATGAPYIASATVAGDALYTADFAGYVRCFR